MSTYDLVTQQYGNAHQERIVFSVTDVGYPLAGGEEVEVVGGDGGQFVGTSNDQVVRNIFYDLNDSFKYSILNHKVLDVIIDMPPGFRTKEQFDREYNSSLNQHFDKTGLLEGVPLGLLLVKLFLRIRQRYPHLSNDEVKTILGSFAIGGVFYRFKNRVDVGEGVPSEADPEIPYYPKSVAYDCETFYFNFLSLDRVVYAWNFQGPQSDASITDIYFRGIPNITLSQYCQEFTKADGGSDITFVIFSATSHIYKRFESIVRVGYVGVNARFKTRVIRSAGLRQVLFEPYEGVIGDFRGTNTPFYEPSQDYRFYVPYGGDGNCFEGAIRWAFLQNANAAAVAINEELDVEACLSLFKKIWHQITEACASSMKMPVERYKKKYRENGYPTAQMRKIACYFRCFTGYRLVMWYRQNRGECSAPTYEGDGKWIDLLSQPNSNFEGENYRGEIVLFQCTDDGVVRDDRVKREREKCSKAEMEAFQKGVDSGELGRMMHCIAVYPAPSFFNGNQIHRVNTRVLGATRNLFISLINEDLTRFFKLMYKKKKYWETITELDIARLVECQKIRYKEKVVNTLIFGKGGGSSGADGGSSSSSFSATCAMSRPSKKRRETVEPEALPYYVCAYDLETIDNCSEAHFEDRVWSPFSKRDILMKLDEDQKKMLDPIESQIPFSAQWVMVNASDTGEFLRRKKEEEEKSGVSSIIQYPGAESSEFFLSDAHTELGDGLLGKCITEMMVKVAEFTHFNGGKICYCYAHNGAHFDSYVLLQYQKFEISYILKTGRGILSVSIRVPISMTEINLKLSAYDYRVDDLKTPKVTLIFRDTILHVPGSLRRLCKGFNVPPEYCKLDFPIERVNYRNYNNPALKPLLKSYGENDVKALAVIMVKINNLIGASPWRPANITNFKPPITQFITCMAMIRASTRLHFEKVLPNFMHPKAIDIAALRRWVQDAAKGGRVNAYAKTYVSPFTQLILMAALSRDEELLKGYYSLMTERKQCMQVLDFTSLYPYAMDSCPMPTGALFFLPADACLRDIDAIGCSECDRLLSLCPKHRCTFNNNDSLSTPTELRPFSIIIVKNIVYKGFSADGSTKRNMCGRKVFNKNTDKPLSLLYSLESDEEFSARSNSPYYSGTSETLHSTEGFTNIDLYWMRRQGFSFEIVGGFSFAVTSVYNLFIGPAFKERIKAKKEGNKLLSDFLKLNYNGSFGITTQQDILDCYFVTRINESLHYIDPRESVVRKEIYKSKMGHHVDGLTACEELTGEATHLPNRQSIFQKTKKEHLGEYFADQSPMQIGAAVLAWSRHIANLVMFNISDDDQTYTDTDSIAISQAAIDSLPQLQALIKNEDDAPLGSLKNDHAENNGTDPRVFLSMIGAKKVKMHLTLNQEGKITVFNTFKGLNVATQSKNPAKFAEYITAKTLFHLNVESSSPAVEVTAWRRDLQHGVSISNHLQHLSPDTYLEDCKGTFIKHTPCGIIEFFIPHGSKHPVHYPVFVSNTEENCIGRNPCCTQGEWRRKNLENDVWGGYLTVGLFEKFLEDYYVGYDKPEVIDTPEFRQIENAFQLCEQ